ncbi:hypothetical protein [Methanorbis furvi]|uniref:hypothetical protein n=1 Tax=Methanorbis furvi TaxID=3028299 RepID=UPI0030B8A6E2
MPDTSTRTAKKQTDCRGFAPKFVYWQTQFGIDWLRPRKNETHAFGLLTASRDHTEISQKNITEQT